MKNLSTTAAAFVATAIGVLTLCVPSTMAQIPGQRSTLAYQLTHVDTGEPFPSPDGKQIVFEITIQGREQIFIMKTDGTSQKQITHDPANHDSPSWSPDGTRIAFVSDANEHPVIYMMNVDGTNVERLTSLAADSIHPTWSADSTKVIYCADDDLHPPKKNASEIFSVDVKNETSDDADFRRNEYLSVVVSGREKDRFPANNRRHELRGVRSQQRRE